MPLSKCDVRFDVSFNVKLFFVFRNQLVKCFRHVKDFTGHVLNFVPHKSVTVEKIVKSFKVVSFSFKPTTVNKFRKAVNDSWSVYRIFALLFDLSDVRVVCHVAMIGLNRVNYKRTCDSPPTGFETQASRIDEKNGMELPSLILTRHSKFLAKTRSPGKPCSSRIALSRDLVVLDCQPPSMSLIQPSPISAILLPCSHTCATPLNVCTMVFPELQLSPAVIALFICCSILRIEFVK